mmetsp:Transcript_25731/g.60665  ORF Transcript_25731/g.60665 Transcript_25731/m.60665 type:complete len:368 (-) Transcript_25731:130-1233(-)
MQARSGHSLSDEDAVTLGIDESSEDGQIDDLDQDQSLNTGPFMTLQAEGPQVSEGSKGHPETCTACTFYCFTRRGCNRGAECRFCHLTHESKLKKRRDAWKKQQREKRRSLRGRTGPQAWQPGFHGGTDGDGALTCNSPAVNVRSIGGKSERALAANDCRLGSEMGFAGSMAVSFTYSPANATLTIGQDCQLLPELAAAPLRFRLLTQLPKGLALDRRTGVICGAPELASLQTAVYVEVDLLDGSLSRAAIKLEVVDLTQGGFVVGHVSEVEPGKFMLLMHVPNESKGGDDEEGGLWPAQGASKIQGLGDWEHCLGASGNGEYYNAGDRTFGFTEQFSWHPRSQVVDRAPQPQPKRPQGEPKDLDWW